MAIEEIIFVRNNLSPFEIKMAEVLKKHGYKVNSVTFNEIIQEHKKVFDKNFYFLKKEQMHYNKLRKLFYLPKFIISLKKIKNSALIGVTSSSNWFVAIMFLLLRKKSQCTIYFPYDIAYFRFKDYKTNRWYNRFCEKNNFRHCDGIMHKVPEGQLKYLPKEFMAIDKPTIQFLPYCYKDLFIEINKEYFQNKLSLKDGKIHLVYGGKVPYKDPIFYSFLDVFKNLVKHKIHVDAYATNYDLISNDKEFKELQKNKFFTLHKPIYGKNLQIELSKYDWALNPVFYKPGKVGEEWMKICTGNKMSTYLEAGLPMLINDNPGSFYGDIIVENGFGRIIKPWSGKKIKEIIQSTDYKKIIEDININRKKFSLEKNITRLIRFIDHL